MRIRGGLSGSSGNLQLPEATLGGGRRRDPETTPSPHAPEDECATASIAAASARTPSLRRSLLRIVLFVGVWAFLAAFAGTARADEGRPAEDRPSSADAPAGSAGDVPAMPPAGQDATVDHPQVPAPAAGAPTPHPEDVPASPADSSTVAPPGFESPPAVSDVVAPPILAPAAPSTAAPADTDETAASDTPPEPVLDPYGMSGAPAPLVGPPTVVGLCSDAAPQPIDSPRAGYLAATDADDLTPAAGGAAEATAQGVTTPALPATDPPAPPLQRPPDSPIAPPVLPPGPGASGGCANSVSAGGQHDTLSPLAIVVLDAVALLPSGSNGFGSGLTPDVAGRAEDPGCRPT